MRRFAIILLLSSAVGGAAALVSGVFPWRSYEPVVSLAVPEGVSSLSFAQAQDAYRQATHVFVDARPVGRYTSGHIEGAISIPCDDVQQAVFSADLPLTAEVPLIVYGEAAVDESAVRVAQELTRLGMTNVAVYREGWQRWAANVDSSPLSTP